jgi:hypothetical protein
MVDALCRARLWLKPDGSLIDLRPAETIPEVLVGSAERVDIVGVLTVEAERHQRHASADRALAEVLDRHLFVLEEARKFTFLTYADSADELRHHIASKWKQSRLDDATCLRTAAALRAYPGAQLRLRERVAIRRLKPIWCLSS